MNDTTPNRLKPYRKYLVGDDLQSQLGLLQRLDQAGQLGRPADYVSKYPPIRNIHPKVKIPSLGIRYDPTEWDSPLIEQVRHLRWEWTEKIDGTNIRIGWDGVDQVNVVGREHRDANLPGHETGLPDLIADTFTVAAFAKAYAGKPMTIYCEGYGPKIGPRGHLYGDEPALVVLDVVINGWWLQRPGIVDVAATFGLQAPPLLNFDSVDMAQETVRSGFVSLMAPEGTEPFHAEGLVGRLELDLLTRDRKTIRCKIKHEYFHGKHDD